MLKRVVGIIRFIAERDLAFRGDNELVGSPGNGDFLAQHIETQASCYKGQSYHLSSTIMKELVNVMGEQVLGEIISRVNTRCGPHCPTGPCIEEDGPVVRFVIFMANKGHGAQEMFKALMEFLKIHDLDLGNCRGQSYDNASAISGKYNGLQAKVREMNSLSSWIPCTTHSLNLVWKNAAKCFSNAVHFFTSLKLCSSSSQF